MPQPIAADFNGATAVLAQTLPPGFITFDTGIFYLADDLQKAELLSGQIVLECASGAAAGFSSARAEAIR